MAGEDWFGRRSAGNNGFAEINMTAEMKNVRITSIMGIPRSQHGHLIGQMKGT